MDGLASWDRLPDVITQTDKEPLLVKNQLKFYPFDD
jgi:hypothetical protein